MNEQDLKKVFQGKKAKKDEAGVELPLTGFTIKVTFEKFKAAIEKVSAQCRYCGLTPEQSKILFDLQQVTKTRHDATRGGRRGRRLELDRLRPAEPYDCLENLVWACYWCNNAKTNFFSKAEFEPIGRAIGDALRKILVENEQRIQ